MPVFGTNSDNQISESNLGSSASGGSAKRTTQSKLQQQQLPGAESPNSNGVGKIAGMVIVVNM